MGICDQEDASTILHEMPDERNCQDDITRIFPYRPRVEQQHQRTKDGRLTPHRHQSQAARACTLLQLRRGHHNKETTHPFCTPQQKSRRPKTHPKKREPLRKCQGVILVCLSKPPLLFFGTPEKHTNKENATNRPLPLQRPAYSTLDTHWTAPIQPRCRGLLPSRA